MGRELCAAIKVLFATLAVVALSPSIAFAQSAGGDPSGRLIRACTHTELHAGSCVVPATGRIATLIDAVDSNGDRCRALAKGGGGGDVLCRFDGSDWREASAKPKARSGAMAASAADRVLDILHPPPGSGLVPPVGDGIDGKPTAPRTNDAPAINAAIQYACDNGYDIAFLGAGSYRIGAANTIQSFYSGIRIDAKTCPGGIKFYGAGVGRTNLLVNGEAGQYVIFTGDKYNDATKVERIGWGIFGGPALRQVTNVVTGVSPPVVVGSAESFLEDGDTVYARNCAGSVEMNERHFKVNNCTHVAPFSCELQDEFGVDIDATLWSPWSSETECIVGKLNPEFDTEIAYLTIRDDDTSAHSHEICNAFGCQQAQEESHGIGILQGGGVVEVHHVVIDTVGDEGIDISAPESPTYVHDVTFLNMQVSGPSIYQGVGIRIEDVLVHKPISFSSHGEAFALDPGSKNWRIVDARINRLVATGGLMFGFTILTNPTGFDGQYVSGVHLTNSAIALRTPAYYCNGGMACGSFWIRSTLTSFPIENIEISGNTFTGTAYVERANGEGELLISNNTFVPIPNIEPKWGIHAESKNTTFEGNHVSGFRRGCMRLRPYRTNGGSNSSVTTVISGNVLDCDSNLGSQDSVIGPLSAGDPPIAANDNGYLRIFDNQLSAGPTDYIRHGISITLPLRGVEICRNTIAIDANLGPSSTIGIWSYALDQVICDNQISVAGSGIRVDGAGAKIVGNQISGNDSAWSDGILAFGSSNSLISKNSVSDYRSANSTGIKIEAGASLRSHIQIIGNTVHAASGGITLIGNPGGLDQVSIAGNVVDLDGLAPAQAILLHNATNVRVTANDLVGLGGSGVDALRTTGTTDFIIVRDNLAEGGGTFKFGTTGGDATCNESGGVGDNSTCSDNDLQ